jgi:hypothetical protein
VRARGPRAAALALAASALLSPATATASVKLSTSPGLKPSFRLGVPDYVSRCKPGEPLRFSVSASGGDTVSIAGQPKRGGDFTVPVTRTTGEEVAVAVTANGRRSTHHVRCLPRDFPGWTAHRNGKPEAQWYVLTPIGPNRRGYVAVFDARGVPVWWMFSSAYGPWDGKLLANGNLAWTRQFNDLIGLDPNEAWEEHTLDGRTVRVLKTVGSPTDFHDLEQTPDGHFLLDTYPPRSDVDLSAYDLPKHANVYDGAIQELAADGTLVWSWNSKDHIKLSEIRPAWWDHVKRGQRKKPPDRRAYDLVHVNSVEPDGDGYILSFRFLDAVYRIDRKTGAIDWKLGGTKRKESLKVKNDRLGSDPFSGQHDARLWTDRTLTVYDNGTKADRRPRVVRYRIDAKKRTATLLEGFDEGDEPYSGALGSARKLPGGNWVVGWGGTTLTTERTPSGRRVFYLRFNGDMHSYRSFPIPRGRLSAQQLRKGMNAVAKAGAAGTAR